MTDRPDRAAVAVRRQVVQDGLTANIEALRKALPHTDASVRSSALVGLARNDELTDDDIVNALADKEAHVRRTLAKLAAARGDIDLAPLLADADPTVVEMAAWAAGERVDVRNDLRENLQALTTDHDDALCREAAVAALGAIGDARSLPTILRATEDKATVRRRAILALAPFDTPDVTAALEKALADRDWQVRQAAEDLIA